MFLHCHFLKLKIVIDNIPFLTIPADVLAGFCIFCNMQIWLYFQNHFLLDSGKFCFFLMDLYNACVIHGLLRSFLLFLDSGCSGVCFCIVLLNMECMSSTTWHGFPLFTGSMSRVSTCLGWMHSFCSLSPVGCPFTNYIASCEIAFWIKTFFISTRNFTLVFWRFWSPLDNNSGVQRRIVTQNISFRQIPLCISFLK